MKLAPSVPEDVRGTTVRADLSAVEQILVNLVDNAAKYAGRAENRTIHLEARRSGADVVLTVRDHGPGVSAQEARRLFRPFEKSAADAASSGPGIGLGLALSRRLARAMGGDLRLAREVTDGAAFELVIPITSS